MLSLKTNKVQSISSVSLAGLAKDVRIPTGANHRRTSKGSLSGSLAGFEQLEVCIKTFLFFRCEILLRY